MGLTSGLDEGYVSKLVMGKERLFQFTLIGEWSMAGGCSGGVQLRVSAAGCSEGSGV